jgi:hypothetical protein
MDMQQNGQTSTATTVEPRRRIYTPMGDAEMLESQGAALGTAMWLAAEAPATPVRLEPSETGMVFVTWEQCGAAVTLLLHFDFPVGAPEVVTAGSLGQAISASTATLRGLEGFLEELSFDVAAFRPADGDPPTHANIADSDVLGFTEGLALDDFMDICAEAVDVGETPSVTVAGVELPAAVVEAVGTTVCFAPADADEEVYVVRNVEGRVVLAGFKALIAELR